MSSKFKSNSSWNTFALAMPMSKPNKNIQTSRSRQIVTSSYDVQRKDIVSVLFFRRVDSNAIHVIICQFCQSTQTRHTDSLRCDRQIGRRQIATMRCRTTQFDAVASESDAAHRIPFLWTMYWWSSRYSTEYFRFIFRSKLTCHIETWCGVCTKIVSDVCLKRQKIIADNEKESILIHQLYTVQVFFGSNFDDFDVDSDETELKWILRHSQFLIRFNSFKDLRYGLFNPQFTSVIQSNARFFYSNTQYIKQQLSRLSREYLRLVSTLPVSMLCSYLPWTSVWCLVSTCSIHRSNRLRYSDWILFDPIRKHRIDFFIFFLEFFCILYIFCLSNIIKRYHMITQKKEFCLSTQ